MTGLKRESDSSREVMSTGRKVQQFFINLVLFLLAAAALAPFILLISSSITDEGTLIRNGYSFFPEKISFAAYEYLFASGIKMVRAYGISILVTVVGTVISLGITSTMAYPLSRKDLPGRNAFLFFVFFTMLFNGGLTPSYMMWTRIFHIKNTIFALIIPGLLMSAFNLILMKNYFAANIPGELLEAARVDGAGEFHIFCRIVLPISTPIMATIGLFVALGYWNDWQNGLYYLSNRMDLYSLQNYLNKMMQDIQYLNSGRNEAMMANLQGMTMPSTAIRMALSVMGVIPVMVLYPFFQKYFTKGITIGSVKG